MLFVGRSFVWPRRVVPDVRSRAQAQAHTTADAPQHEELSFGCAPPAPSTELPPPPFGCSRGGLTRLSRARADNMSSALDDDLVEWLLTDFAVDHQAASAALDEALEPPAPTLCGPASAAQVPAAPPEPSASPAGPVPAEGESPLAAAEGDFRCLLCTRPLVACVAGAHTSAALRRRRRLTAAPSAQVLATAGRVGGWLVAPCGAALAPRAAPLQNSQPRAGSHSSMRRQRPPRATKDLAAKSSSARA